MGSLTATITTRVTDKLPIPCWEDVGVVDACNILRDRYHVKDIHVARAIYNELVCMERIQKEREYFDEWNNHLADEDTVPKI